MIFGTNIDKKDHRQNRRISDEFALKKIEFVTVTLAIESVTRIHASLRLLVSDIVVWFLN